MLNLESRITIDKDTIASPNLCDQFTDADLVSIGERVYEQYATDEQSREAWMRRSSAAMDLAMQVQKDKNFPWPGCSNVDFPLITIAALQFHSRAYPAIFDSDTIVNCRVIGPDPDGAKMARSERINQHMSYQLLEEDSDWESEMDRALIYVPIVGCGWKKTYYDGSLGRNDSEFIPAKDLVVNYWSKSVETCRVKTHCIPFDRNTIHSRILSGTFRDIREMSWYQADAPIPQPTQYTEEEDNRTGVRAPTRSDETTPFIGLEQHCWFDFDGDGYEEPYIITIDKNSKTVLRIVLRVDREEDITRTLDGEIVHISADEYFTKIPFIPSPDGGIYDIGFGTLIGPLNESVNSALNQIFDAGTLYNTSGGFLGRGAKIRGGVINFSPFDWNRVDSTGDDLRKNILPFPVREPSTVLFQVLSFLVGYVEKISGAVDITTGGNPGQNTPATTTQEMVAQGQKVYAAIFKRIWLSLKREFKRLYVLNGRYLPPGKIEFAGGTDYITRSDYLGDPSAVVPNADPNVMGDQARFAQAKLLMDIGRGNPLYNPDGINKRFLNAIKVHDIDSVYLGEAKKLPPPMTEKLMVEMLKAQVQTQRLELQKLQFLNTLYEQKRVNDAKIVNLYAQAQLFEQQAGGAQTAQSLETLKTVIQHVESMGSMLDNQIQQISQQVGNEQPTNASGQGNVPSMEGQSGDEGSTGTPTPQAGGS